MMRNFLPALSYPPGEPSGFFSGRFRVFLWLCLAAVLLLPLGTGPAAQAAGKDSGGSQAQKPAFLPLSPSHQQADPAMGVSLPPEVSAPLMPVLPPASLFPDEGDSSGTLEVEELDGAAGPRDAVPETPAPVRTPAPGSRERDMQRRGIVRAELKPGRPMFLSAPYPGILASVLVHDGEKVVQGQAVARFDTQAAEKAVEEARKTLAEAVERVQNTREASAREREGAEEHLARCADTLRETDKRLSQSTLAAPFSGRVTDVRARAGQHMKRGDVVVELAEEGDLEILCTVPSLWINRLAPGHIIWVYVEESAKSYEAEFVRFGGKVDPTTKTIRAYSRFVDTPEELLPGMSGRADFFPRRGS